METTDMSGERQAKPSAASRLQKLASMQPGTFGQDIDLVRIGAFSDGYGPVTVTPAIQGVNICEWIRSHRGVVNQHLQSTGAILFRDFNVHSVDTFELFMRSLSGDIMEYKHRSSPRHAIQNNIYTSTDHPRDQVINMHNEHSYSHEWPMKIVFFCLTPGEEGGETPIADSRKVLANLSPGTIQKFTDKQVMYVRQTGTGLGMTWQDIFQTTDRSAVEDYCSKYQVKYSWQEGDRLRMVFIRPAIRFHPVSKEPIWFNHAYFFNPLSLDASIRDVLLKQDNDSLLPFRTCYGDGSEIEASVIAEIRDTYERTKISFPWQKGDILLLDNMLTAHGRNAFRGDRKILVGMAEPQGI